MLLGLLTEERFGRDGFTELYVVTQSNGVLRGYSEEIVAPLPELGRRRFGRLYRGPPNAHPVVTGCVTTLHHICLYRRSAVAANKWLKC